MTLDDLNAFTLGYLEAALWSSSIEEGFAAAWNAKHGGDFAADCSMQSFGFTIGDLDSSARANANTSCEQFIRANRADLAGEDASRAGHDFWLTRNGHGAGYWDGDYPEPAATRLTDSAHAFGSCDLYVGDDERIYST